MSEAPQGDIGSALAQAARLIGSRPDLAERQAREILAVVPTEPRARMFLGAAQRRQGRLQAARDTLDALARGQPGSPQTHLELGLTLEALGETEASLAALRHAVSLRRELPQAWRAIADQLYLRGDAEGADAAYAQSILTSVEDPDLRAAAEALCRDELAVAEHLLRARLRVAPTDVAALRMLAETGARLGRNPDAEILLARCLELAPGFDAARYNLAIILYRQQKGAEALPHIARLRTSDPTEPGYRNLQAACLSLVGDYDQAIELYEALLAENPNSPKVWMSLGHSLRTAGRRAEAVSAYKRAIAQQPSLGEAYWSLANLKTEPFEAGEIAAMQAALPAAQGEDAFHLEYALGKAFEDEGDYAHSFAHYETGARLRRIEAPYDPDELTTLVKRSKALFTAQFLAERSGVGFPAPDPIFVVGLPRSGSTLIEQILSSHSAVEGTQELPEIGSLVRAFVRAALKEQAPAYPDVLTEVSDRELCEFGEIYIARTRVVRKTAAPRFIDKMPNNFGHLGLIRLILPNARIIDARRHPMASCFSSFKQHFARGQTFSYDLSDLGRYYRDYVELMAHFDEVAPGLVHRVIYEDMVEDTEGEVRRLLDYLGLPFEPACLEFHRTERAVRTASSEQVRRPIFREGLDHWRNYEPWLTPLREALGSTLETWRG